MTSPFPPPVPGPDGFTLKVPDVPQTMLAFRVWRLSHDRTRILSLNAPIYRRGVQGRPSAVLTGLTDTPKGGWPPDKLLAAECDLHPKTVPDPVHTCGIYATTSVDVLDTYLSPDAPVLGVVELGGRVIPGTQGFKAQYARIAAVLLVDPVLTLPHGQLKALAARYGVPALVPHSVVPDDYRDRLVAESLADEVEKFLHNQP